MIKPLESNSQFEIFRFTSGPVLTNAYLVVSKETKNALLIDAPLELMPHLEKTVTENGIHLRAVLLTHSHWDHIGSLSAIQKKWDVKTGVHPLDRKNVESPGSDSLPGPEVSPSTVDFIFEGGTSIEIEEFSLEVVHTPGHSPGSCIFFMGNWLFSGDLLFRDGFGRVDLPSSNPNQMIESLNTLLPIEKNYHVFPGHGEQTTLEREKPSLPCYTSHIAMSFL